MVLASLYSFANDNTLSAFAATSEVVIDWFKKNKMVLDLGKFQAIILDKREHDDTNERIIVHNQQIKVVLS